MDNEQKMRMTTIRSYQKVFSGVEGQEVLMDLLNRGHVLRPTYSPADERSGLLNEGKRELVLYILEMMKIDVKKLHDILSGEEKGELENEKEDEHI